MMYFANNAKLNFKKCRETFCLSYMYACDCI